MYILICLPENCKGSDEAYAEAPAPGSVAQSCGNYDYGEPKGVNDEQLQSPRQAILMEVPKNAMITNCYLMLGVSRN